MLQGIAACCAACWRLPHLRQRLDAAPGLMISGPVPLKAGDILK
jgi:hypothetical protein